MSCAQDDRKSIARIYPKRASEVIKFSEQSWKKVWFATNVYGDKLLMGKNIMIFRLKYQHFHRRILLLLKNVDASGDTALNQVTCPKWFF